MKINPRRLKYSIWFYFILFALGMLCVVWFIQVIFTEQYFLGEMKASLKTKGEQLETLYINRSENEKSEKAFTSAAERVKEMDSVYVVFTTKGYNGIGSVPDECYPSEEFLPMYYDEYGDVIRRVRDYAAERDDGIYSGSITSNENKTGTLYVYAKIVSENGAEDPVYLILISSLENVTALLSLIQKQLGIISLIIIVIAFFISLIIASNLSRPLTEMSETAGKLAHGDFSVEFNANGYAEIRELSDTLNYMKEELKKTGVLQRELLANVTHDLKTPLTMVKAYAEMIKDISGNNKEKRDKHAQVIIDEADRLTMLVNDILNLSKLQSSVDDLEPELVNLSDLTKKVVDHFSSFSENNGYVIKTEIVPDLFVVCDAKKIEQVIYNLIGNAINYTGEDKTVNVFLTENEGKVLFEVVDSGKGIDEDKIDTIWEKYYRASDTHKRPVKGTGLGLSIVKAILESHNLKYGVISKKNEGSNFFVEFNACKENE
ncbi:MAG: HAMP domain-containing histidine kinase [Clostridia bacterium]|nr:HAMP domain-containing histidine kinase [Clostridia bacterium]